MYNPAKRVYNRYKLVKDESIFKQLYPNAKYINYTQREIQRQRKQGYYSQYGQDYFLWSEYLSGESLGEFIDIGANKPIVNSNSLFLEKKGWKGLAIDPIQHFEPLWLEHRKTPFICGAVGDSVVEQAFIEILPDKGWEHTLSGFKTHVRDEDLKIYRYKEYSVSARPLDHYLTEPRPVDLIMIDVEGAEIQVLEGINFSVFSPRFLLVENDSTLGGCQSIREYLKGLDYECVARVAATDDFFIKI
jgi:FkbM family methyltransferase